MKLNEQQKVKLPSPDVQLNGETLLKEVKDDLPSWKKQVEEKFS